MTVKELPILVVWEKVVSEILDRTIKFPKHARFTFSTRIDNLALDIFDQLVEARYSSAGSKRELLQKANISLARLRVLLRLSCDRRFLNIKGLEHLARQLDEAGKMIGGWTKQQEGEAG